MDKMKITTIGTQIMLEREQWRGKAAYISNYPGLIDEVKKNTWTFTGDSHPYLNCSKLGVTLHKFVLQFLYGKEKLDEMLNRSNIIEHLDNNGLNCTYENLHILSDNNNKAKAFSIDKKNAALNAGELVIAPALITDVYYSHKKKFYQLQVFFNKNMVFNNKTKNFVEEFAFQYNDFDSLFIDWLYCFECIKKEEFNYYKFHAVKAYEKDIITFELNENEKDATFIYRDGKYFLKANTDPQKGPVAFMSHIPFEDMEENNE